MAHTIVGLFDRMDDARNAVHDLVDAGFDRERISMVARDTEGQRGGDRDIDARADDDDVGESIAGGAATGGVLGGIAGVLIGLNAVAIPGIGPILAIGPIAGGLAGLGIGAAAGGLVGGLAAAGISEEEAHVYAEGVRRGGTLVTVQADDSRAAEAASIMNRHNPVDIDDRASRWREEGWEQHDASAEPYSSEQIEEERTRIPVAEEELTVGTRQVQRGGVRVHSHVVEEPVEEQVRVRDEQINVERRPVDRDLDSGELDDAFRERDFEFTETDEEAVVGKRTRVTEEVVVGKDVDEHVETIRDTVRRTQVDVEQISPEHRQSFQEHYQSTFGNGDRNGDFGSYEPAYAYGHQLGQNEQTRQREWADLEPEARRRWENDYDQEWDSVRGAVEYGWTSGRGRR